MSEQYESSPRDTDTLHAAIQAHIVECRQCTEVSQKGTPRGFFAGEASRMCPDYFRIIAIMTGAPLPETQGG